MGNLSEKAVTWSYGVLWVIGPQSPTEEADQSQIWTAVSIRPCMGGGTPDSWPIGRNWGFYGLGTPHSEWEESKRKTESQTELETQRQGHADFVGHRKEDEIRRQRKHTSLNKGRWIEWDGAKRKRILNLRKESHRDHVKVSERETWNARECIPVWLQMYTPIQQGPVYPHIQFQHWIIITCVFFSNSSLYLISTPLITTVTY
jgi:hypothetical protein